MADDILIKFRTDLNEFRKELDDVKKKVGDVGDNAVDVGGKINTAFTKIGAAVAGVFAVSQITAFTKEAIELAKQADGIGRAFSRLNRVGLLDELRTATKGAVSDMRLMQAAVKADNFKLPLDQLAKLFKFAAQRAKDTGESVDYLVESIVLGISRKSIPILDNLGLSAAEIQTEFAKTGDMATAVGNIIDQSFRDNIQTVETFSEKVDRMNASMENAKTEFGRFAASVTDALFDIEGFADFFRDIPKIINDETIPAWKKWLSLVNESTMKQAAGQADANNRLKEHVKYLTEQKVYTEKHRDVVLDSLEKQKKAVTELQAKSQLENDGEPNILLDQLWWDLDKAIDHVRSKPLDKYKKKVEETTEETKKLNKETQEFISKKQKSSLDLMTEQLEAQVEADAKGVKMQEEIADRDKAQMDEWVKEQEDAYAQDYENKKAFKLSTQESEQQAQEDQLAEWKHAADQFQTIFNAAFQAISENRQRQLEQDLDAVEQQRANELKNHDLTESQREAINAKYDAKRRKIQLEAWRKERNAKLAMAVIDGAAAVVKALPNYYLVAAAALTAATEIALIGSQPEPKFHTGEIDIRPDGKRRMKGGEFRATLIEGESVINAKATAKYRDELEAINSQKYEDLLWKKHILPAIREREKIIEREVQQGLAQNVAKSLMYQNFNDGNIVEMLKRVNSTSKENTQIIAGALRSSRTNLRQP